MLLSTMSYAGSLYAPLKVEKLIAQNFKGKHRAIHADKFYLLGWSKNGKKMAYAVVEDTDMKNTFSLRVYIQNLVDDSIVWEMHHETEFEEYGSFKDYWKKNHPYLRFVLKQNKIELARDFKLRKAPFAYKNDTLNFKVVPQKNRASKALSGYKLFLTSKLKGQKLLTHSRFKVPKSEMGYGTISKVTVLGYLQGRDKSRIALLVAKLEFGFEGVETVRYEVVGASLKPRTWR